ncbi:MAG: arginine repressor [Acidimicrobiia bacterium]|nr:MAG: arginine repressor [Acidimicrobiia bacterium]
MSKRYRQAEMLRLIEQQDISTQSEMVVALGEVGIEAAQATISRDIAELGLVKVRGDGKRMIYVTPGTKDNDRIAVLSRALRRWASAIRGSSNLVLIETPAGYASALAQVIDEAGHPDVLGTVAGDNTVLVVADDPVTGAELATELLTLSEPAGHMQAAT